MIKIIIVLSFLITVIYAKDTTKYTIHPRIINGTQVSPDNDMWQFIVALKYNNNQYCGGSLVAPNWVITAAHCLVDETTGESYVPSALDTIGVGSYNLDSMVDYSIKQWIIHPFFNEGTLDNDIALIELNNDIINISSIAYDISHKLSVNTQTKVAGWGKMSTTSELYPTDLREALTPILDYNQCNSNYDGEITNNMLCAGYFVSTRDSCFGDSGGPLIVDHTLVGIVSWGSENCAEDGYPGVYTKVQNYANWIKGYLPQDDMDGDGVIDSDDAFPNDASESIDTDGDGIGDNADLDDDNDGISDIDEISHGLNPLTASDAEADFDNDGFSNAIEISVGSDIRIEISKPKWVPVMMGETIILIPYFSK